MANPTNGRHILNVTVSPELVIALKVYSAKQSILLYVIVEELLREALNARNVSVEELIS